jgi:hypothetical protein
VLLAPAAPHTFHDDDDLHYWQWAWLSSSTVQAELRQRNSTALSNSTHVALGGDVPVLTKLAFLLAPPADATMSIPTPPTALAPPALPSAAPAAL